MTPAPGGRAATSYLLVDDPAVPIQRRVAEAVGPTAAHLLQQLHWYLINFGRIQEGRPDDRPWVKATYGDWHDEFTWMSVANIRKTFTDLEDQGIVKAIRVGESDGVGSAKWYTIDYGRFEAVVEAVPEPERRPRGLLARLLKNSGRFDRRQGEGADPKARSARALGSASPKSAAEPIAKKWRSGRQNLAPRSLIFSTPNAQKERSVDDTPYRVLGEDKEKEENSSNGAPSARATEAPVDAAAALAAAERETAADLLRKEGFDAAAVARLIGLPGLTLAIVQAAIQERRRARGPVGNPHGLIHAAIVRLIAQPRKLTPPRPKEPRPPTDFERDLRLVRELTHVELARHRAAVEAEAAPIVLAVWRDMDLQSPTLVGLIAARVRAARSGPDPPSPASSPPPRHGTDNHPWKGVEPCNPSPPSDASSTTSPTA